jgi:hypothetical protein
MSSVILNGFAILTILETYRAVVVYLKSAPRLSDIEGMLSSIFSRTNKMAPRGAVMFHVEQLNKGKDLPPHTLLLLNLVNNLSS